MFVTPLLPVVTAAQARELDALTIRGLPDSYTLMHRAAAAAAASLLARDARSAAVFVGPGNNGGDGWLIAGLLRDGGWRVTVHVAAEPRTDDAQRARREAEQGGPFAAPTGDEELAIDAILGTGASGAPRGDIATAIAALRQHTGTVIAIDIPSGLDATTGEDHGAVAAANTLTFGSVKRGQLLRRDLVGRLAVLDIGLVPLASPLPQMVTMGFVRNALPHLRADAYKGTRGRVGIVGGDAGMAGAVIIAANGAHASGAGMVRADVDAASATAVQVAAPFATVGTWQHHTPEVSEPSWPNVLVIGPGLDGTRDSIRHAVARLLHTFRGPVVLDAGALTAFAVHASQTLDIGTDELDADEDPVAQLRHALGGRPALLTPHIGEFNRFFARGAAPTDRFSAASVLAQRLQATVLLKGVPTIIVSPEGDVLVSATGNPALAVGGSGDLLAGIAGALLAQQLSPLQAGAVAAHAHGMAGDLAVFHTMGTWRGVTFDGLMRALSSIWSSYDAGETFPIDPAPTLLTLPPVPTR